MAISSLSSQFPQLSLLNYMDDDTETDNSSTSLGLANTLSSAQSKMLKTLASGGDSSDSVNPYGLASTLGLSPQALAALGMSSASSSGNTTGNSDSSDKKTDITKTVASVLSKGGPNGAKFAAALDDVFKNVSNKDAVAVKDQVMGLIAQLKDPTMDINASSAARRTTRNGNAPSVLTLSGSQGSILRLESSTASNGATSLRLTYSGTDIGAVDLSVTRSTDSAGKPTLNASVEQRKILARGRLSAPVSTDSYSGSI